MLSLIVGSLGCWVFVFFVSIRILSWNVRGLNKPQKHAVVKKFIEGMEV